MADNIVLYNSWSKKKEVFKPITAGAATIYNCGPTVYKRPHLGNLRRFLFADVLRRTLEFCGYRVQDITNITDVGHLTQDELEAGEDKLEKEARAQKVTVQAIAEREIANFLADLKALNIEAAKEYPRATDNIEEMISMIKELVSKGFAYETNVGVFFEVAKFKGYGRLSGNTVDQLEKGSRLAVRKEKKHPSDFALWLTDDPDHLQQWDSPWGRGYPGWHIECSAMSTKFLGNNIDIHTGGEDNKFPHHENEIAQAEAASGHKFVNYWMHNAHLQIGGEKMAKSGGEQVTLDTIRDKGFSPIVFRWLVLSSHYRTRIDFSWEKMAEMQAGLENVTAFMRRLLAVDKLERDAKYADQVVIEQFKKALADDLNSPKGLAVLQEYVSQVNRMLAKDTEFSEIKQGELRNCAYNTVMEMDRILGVMDETVNEQQQEEIPTAVSDLGEARARARINKDYATADSLKQEIIAAGFIVEDTSSGYRLLRKPKQQ